jgi:hypothetical protein
VPQPTAGRPRYRLGVADGERHWIEWHEQYADPSSSLSRRLRVVQRRLDAALLAAPPGPIRVISVCSGQGRDVIGVLTDHPRRDDVQARLVELDPQLVADARDAATAAGLGNVEAIEGDASVSSAYSGAVPADVVLVCGVFGNISDGDIRDTIGQLPSLCASNATVIWTRHRRPPDLTPSIRAWFEEAEFVSLAFDAEEGASFGVGTQQFRGVPRDFRPHERLFTFEGDGYDARF